MIAFKLLASGFSVKQSLQSKTKLIKFNRRSACRNHFETCFNQKYPEEIRQNDETISL